MTDRGGRKTHLFWNKFWNLHHSYSEVTQPCTSSGAGFQVDGKGFPSGGKEHPSRGRAWRKVKFVMRIISEQKARRPGKNLGWSSRIMGLTRVLVGILFLALLYNPVPILGVTFPGSYSVTLAWNPSLSTNIVSYNVYCGLASGSYDSVESVTGTNVTITGLAAGTIYYFTATAVDALGVESPFSNEAIYTTGVPTVQICTAPAGQFGLTVSGLIGQTYDIEATQDLVTWTIIGTVTLDASGSSGFTDTNAACFPQRFYRTHETP
jgi:Fibronectin type III domain